NEVPGVECRIALLENGRLDEYFVERASSATVVGNIYKARVTNIEPAIQAAFVDFGLGESGFLHVSDLHPKYFPGADLKEQVGKKIPRKQRPPIQDALKKGQEILVQVLKQGIGTKGPTVTSYLSIPGRLMVMMPDMDRVGVSRKVADDDERKRMREILDSLDLPDNFGFIVRTAGFESSKLELKRDVAYLKRLWEQMDRRIQNTGAPCLLYAESDLLIRTIRDVLDASIKTIVTDHPAAFERARSFLKVSGVTAGPDVRYYDRNLPLFSAFGAEKQIASLHLREVPLVSGGALVIEQTEALVAIDVNSGRSRSAKDSETNAFETNKEAVDEICRQLRLRDLGGLIVNDLIDMRHQKHREEIERRIMRNLKRDRAKSTVLPISEFGIVEMTRQRMRPNTKKANFDLCPTCEGTGEAPRPDSVAADALRRAGVVLENEQVRRIELVCSRSIANILSVDKKKEIELFEERSSRKIDVQVSENILEKRVDIYAYDEEGADVEINKQVRLKVPKIADLPTEIDPDDARNAKKSGKRRRRRGRGKNPPADATAIALSGGFDIDDEFEDELDASPDATGDSAEESSEEGSESGGRRKRRRRRRGRGRRRQELEAEQRELESKSIRIYALAKELGVTSQEILERCREAEGFDNLKNHMSSLEGDPLLEVRGWFRPEEPPVPEEEPGETEAGDGRAESPDDEDGKPRRRRRRRRGRRGRNRDQEDGGSSSEVRAESSDDPGTDASGRTSDSPDGEDGEDRPRKRRRRRRGRGRRRSEDSPEQESGSNDEAGTDRESPDRGEKRPGAEDPPRESGSAGKDDGESGSTPETGSNSSSGEPAPEAPAKPKRRSLYGGRMRRVSNTGRPAED
ncbi:MAG: translation initiation factor IF-2 N-terminal domain-containing protein, partial [Planctomycetota bacterium]|nr:translation initiation factor IF-2 N-terminal domain-containing protein [Planctomycetota bacterium]